MLLSEAIKILTYIQSLDRRIGDIDEFKAQAWKDVLHPELDFDKARGFIVTHYARSGDCIMPYHINEAFKGYRNAEANRFALPEPEQVADPETTLKRIAELRAMIKPSDAPDEPSEPIYSSLPQGAKEIPSERISEA